MVYSSWEFIKDLPENWSELNTSELASLASIWKEHSEQLQERDAVTAFNERLRREWAIETGIIENLYSIDRGVTQLLIEKGISASLISHGSTDKPVEQIIPILKDQENVLEGLFDFVKQIRDLSTSYIKELHQGFTKHQETVQAKDETGKQFEVSLLRGEWKKLPNNPTRPNGKLHYYCPPEHVPAEMDRLIDMHLEHEKEGVPPEVSAAWLHHRFTQIHPFQDGNGRVARALASLVFLRHGHFPLVIKRGAKDEYITALETADHGDLQLLVNLFTSRQKELFVKALSLSENVLQEQEDAQLQDVISSAINRIKIRKQDLAEEIKTRSVKLSKKLEDIAFNKLLSTSNSLNDLFSAIHGNYCAEARQSDNDSDHWFKTQIIEVATKLDYFANTREYRSWIRLKIIEERHTEIVISFHTLGFDFVGVMAVSAFLEHRDRSEDGETTVDGPHPVCKEVFQFTYLEEYESVSPRFHAWLGNVLLLGMDQWRRQI